MNSQKLGRHFGNIGNGRISTVVTRFLGNWLTTLTNVNIVPADWKRETTIKTQAAGTASRASTRRSTTGTRTAGATRCYRQSITVPLLRQLHIAIFAEDQHQPTVYYMIFSSSRNLNVDIIESYCSR